ncbi:hypothetical protein NDU88_000324 [Pleurodeles waltl]|uniref:Uncharacterized protein n=1 Tax=Pleurodeles waltl TaxID=8319 RepID=A0AAV7S5Q0_PLEWA|nr:hypothetical protein NDU88_000324 [Pleurodeles waltl]
MSPLPASPLHLLATKGYQRVATGVARVTAQPITEKDVLQSTAGVAQLGWVRFAGSVEPHLPRRHQQRYQRYQLHSPLPASAEQI